MEKVLFHFCSLKTLLAVHALTALLWFCFEFKSAKIRANTYRIKINVVSSPCTPQDANDDLLVHIDCPIKERYKFKPPREFAENVPAFTGVFMETEIEMFQSSINNTRAGEWQPYLLHRNGALNYMPFLSSYGRKFAPQIQAGGFVLNAKGSSAFRNRKLIPLKDDGVFEPSVERPPLFVNSSNTQVFENTLYSGNPFDPKLGDVRIRFYGSSATHISAIGVQSRASLWNEFTSSEPLKRMSLHSLNCRDATTFLIAEGDHDINSLLDSAESRLNPYSTPLVMLRILFPIVTALLIFRKLREPSSASQVRCSAMLRAMIAILSSIALTITVTGLMTFSYNVLKALLQLSSAALTFGFVVLLLKFCNLSFKRLKHNYMEARAEPKEPEIEKYSPERYAAL